MYRPTPSPRRKWLYIALLAFACGCSGSNDEFKKAKDPTTIDAGADAGDAGDTRTAIDPTLASSQEALVGAECSLLHRCCSAQELKDRFGIDGDEAQCEDFQSALPTSIHLANLTTSIEQGRLKFDAAMAELCAESYLAQDCSDWTKLSPSNTTLPGCIEMMLPQVEEGGNCKHDYECTTGWCELPDGEEESGTCSSRAAEGDPCFDALCAQGFYCSTFDDACVPQKRDGQACLEDAECLSGACTSNTEGEMQCSAPAPLCAEGLEN